MKKEIGNKNLLFWLLLLGSLCLGEILGAVSARMLSEESFSETEAVFNDALTSWEMTGKKVFLSLVIEKGKWVLLYYVVGLFRLTAPIAYLLTGIKGYMIGFTATTLLRLGKKALFLYFTIPLVLVELPCLVAMVRLGRLHAKRRFGERQIEKRQELLRTYTLAMTVLFFVLVGESVLEGCLFPWIVQVQ